MKFLFIFAHPDDESFSSGGTIAKLTKAGHEVKLITVTFGELGQLGDPPLTNRENLKDYRKNELECAAKVLGISKIFYLGLKDKKLIKLPVNKIKKLISPILNSENPDVVLTFDKRGGSNHPDHIQTSKAATKAFFEYQEKTNKHTKLYHTAFPRSLVKKLAGTDMEYTAFGKVLGVPDQDITTIIDITSTFDQKIKAAKCHQTQKKDWSRLIKRHEFFDLKKEFFQLISENNLV